MGRGKPRPGSDPTMDNTQTRAVSPVVAVILLVGITVALGTGVALFALDISNETMSEVDETAEEPFTADAPEDTTFRVLTGEDTVEVYYRDGPAIDATRLYVEVDGTTHQWDHVGTVEPDDSVEVPANGDTGTVLVTWEYLDEREVLERDDR